MHIIKHTNLLEIKKGWPKDEINTLFNFLFYLLITQIIFSSQSPMDCAHPGGQAPQFGDRCSGVPLTGWKYMAAIYISELRLIYSSLLKQIFSLLEVCFSTTSRPEKDSRTEKLLYEMRNANSVGSISWKNSLMKRNVFVQQKLRDLT